MFNLSFIILFVHLITTSINSQTSPHGDQLILKCDVCHISTDWTTILTNRDSFNHDTTGFKLEGQHQKIACKECHADLIFDHAKKECNSCHQDYHQPTVGLDCERCHTTTTWIIKSRIHAGQFEINGKTDCTRCHGTESWKITKFDHNTSRFKLEGSHAFVSCNGCHKEVIDEKGKYVQYKFKNIECINCHY